ncbi:Heat-stable enterotoxin II (plasmid) [Klebsiella pneumoniae]|uniref:Heat-stable enterotoxin II n=1 Tax=Klebsiella pneumoniae TaxID=573 RepID=UPI003981BA2F
MKNKNLAFVFIFATFPMHTYANKPPENGVSTKESLCTEYRRIAKEYCKKGYLGILDGAAGACFGAQIMLKAKGC